MISIAKIFSAPLRRSTQEALRPPPRWIIFFLVVGLALQLLLSTARQPPAAKFEDFSPPPSLSVLRLAALGDTIAFAKLAMFWLQNFDNQPGLAIPFRTMDYEALALWLETILALDPKSEYPLYAALRFYSPIPDETKSRRMLTFIHEQFPKDPERRWRWLSFAAVDARHRLKDEALALTFLNDVSDQATQGKLPPWVHGVHWSLMREAGALQSARQLVGSLLHHGGITDPGELKFLSDWLEALEAEETK